MMKKLPLLSLPVIFALCVLALPLAAGPQPHLEKVAPRVLAAIADGGQTDFLVVLEEQADLSAADGLSSKRARGRFVRAALWETAQRSQASLRAWLDAQGVSYRPFYIVNLIHVQAGDRALLEALTARPEVARVEANPRVQGPRAGPFSYLRPAAPGTVEWNVDLIGAPAAWDVGYTGQGIVIGGQDTGYDWDHPALLNAYRGWDGGQVDHDFNWHDAVHSGGGVCRADSPEPCDDDGHGTATLGILVGDDGGSNQIGVAPDARWIGCRSMDRGAGTPATYLECFEFFLAPYPVTGTPAQGDPDLAPDVTNNSWTCPPAEGCGWDTLQAAVEAQRAAGILTVVAAGNSGSTCSSIHDPPALYDAAYSVGATYGNDDVASSSSRGPVIIDGSGRLKPDITAPGVSIRSSVAGGGYRAGWQGTSMASPHVAGAVALLWSADPTLRGQIDRTEALLNSSALPRYSTQCGDPPVTVPNNVYGWGRLDVWAALQRLLGGYLQGTVRDAEGLPVAGAEIAAATWTTTSDAAGLYHLSPISGTYTVTATATGFLPRVVPDVTVAAGSTTTLDITLLDGATYTVSGRVRDVYTAAPLSASVAVSGDLVSPVTTDPASGRYIHSLPPGSYTLIAAAVGYMSQAQPITVTGPTTQNFALLPRPPRAGFVSSSPDPVGTTTFLTNTTTGAEPITYTWLFGDGSPPLRLPCAGSACLGTAGLPLAHVYTRVGRYVAWLTATNLGGSDAFSDTVRIVTAELFDFWVYLPLLVQR